MRFVFANGMCIIGVSKQKQRHTMTARELIIKLGGPTKVAKSLGYGRHGAQRVCNWMKRGIPAAIQLQHKKLRLMDQK